MSDFFQRLARWIPGFIREDFLRKLIAVCFAFLLWKKVSNQVGVEEIIRNVPVTIAVPAGIELLGKDDIPRVDVTVRASQRQLNMLQPGELKAQLEIRAGQYQGGGQEAVPLRIRRDNIQSPMGVTVTGFRPEIITVSIDRRANRRIPVRCLIGGELMDNNACGEVKVFPAEVSVSGPESLLRQLDEVTTKPVVLQRENTESFETEVEIPPRRGVLITPSTVRVQVEIYRKYEIRNFRGIRVSLLQAEGRAIKLKAKLDQDQVDISVRGIRDAIYSISEQSLKPFVDLSACNQPGAYRLPVQVWLGNPDIEIREIKPDALEVRVE